MEETLAQPVVEVTTTTIKIPTAIWIQFRAKVLTSGREVRDCLPEAIQNWVNSQPKKRM
jgi:hypothetical protein